MIWADVARIGLAFPEVVEATSYGTPALKVRKRLMVRLRPEDDSIVLLGVPVEERDHLIALMPEAFFTTPHYEGHATLLARLAHAPEDIVARILERRWRAGATRRALAAYDARPS